MGRRCGTDGVLPVEAMSPSRDTSRPVYPCPPICRPLSTAMFVPDAEIPLSPLPPQPLPEGSQRFGMGPRNQARRLPADLPGGMAIGSGSTLAGATIDRQAFPLLATRSCPLPARCSNTVVTSSDFVLIRLVFVPILLQKSQVAPALIFLL
jgi:hypothetical protein